MTVIPAKSMAACMKALTRRDRSLFENVVESRRPDLEKELSGARVLLVGAGGSIGSSTALELVKFPVGEIRFADISENYLAELMRSCRNMGDACKAAKVTSSVADYGGPFAPWLLEEAPRGYDFILNFAAHKHVRGERDVISLASMLDVNILALMRFKKAIEQNSPGGCFFSVSTDKAANPVSLMGASKRIMEDVCFDAYAQSGLQQCKSARFANVAFSNGSLLQSILFRIANQQPVAAPSGVRRYFLSETEAGQLCLLSAILGRTGCVHIPELDPEANLISIEEAAANILATFDFAPLFTEDANEALALAKNPPAGRYPVCLTQPDTAGEKEYEEFVAHGEEALPVSGMPGLSAIAHAPCGDILSFAAQLSERLSARLSAAERYESLTALVMGYVPTGAHKRSPKSLDDQL